MGNSLRNKLAQRLNTEPLRPTAEARFTRADAALSGGGLRTTTAVKVVRDSFTMPPDDYKLLAELQQRCLAHGVASTKSGLLRAGLKALAELPGQKLAERVSGLTNPRPGRRAAP
jgi:hypothetical protein